MNSDITEPFSDEYFMRQALKEAIIAFEHEEVPIGAVLVLDNKIVSRTHNQVELLIDPTAHAEVLAITSACDYLSSKYLMDATIYITVEPCLMCCGALFWSKIGKIVYGASDSKNGFTKYTDKSPFHPKTIVKSGILAEDCANLMKEFFRNKR